MTISAEVCIFTFYLHNLKKSDISNSIPKFDVCIRRWNCKSLALQDLGYYTPELTLIKFHKSNANVLTVANLKKLLIIF